MANVALVLGAGGLTGQAFHAGVISGLADAIAGVREFLAPLPALLAFTAGLLSPAFAAAPERPKDVVVPREVIRLFNGKDLSGFYTWLPKFGRADPDKGCTGGDRIVDQVASVVHQGHRRELHRLTISGISAQWYALSST